VGLAGSGFGNRIRVADLVHFMPDPDSANQNFSNRIRILLALTKINSNIYIFSYLYQSYFFRYLFDVFFYLINGKFT